MTLVAIDGPAGSGKSTVAVALARRLGVPHVDTGAFYRAAALAVLRAGVDPHDEAACAAVVSSAAIQRSGARTLLDGDDVSEEIRGPAVTAAVSAVAAHPRVRAVLLEAQRAGIGRGGAVVEGRDAGTVVVPAADLKVWLTASVAVRAARRAAQLDEQGSEADHAADLARRDDLDSAQMAAAPGAVHLDTTDKTVDEVIDEIITHLPSGQTARSAQAPRRVRPQSAPTVAVVGRPNVGKSTLVNRLAGGREAIVLQRPGITRDRTAHDAEWQGRRFTVVDTGGWLPSARGMDAAVAAQAEAAVRDADLVLLVVDATVGVVEEDAAAAEWLRRRSSPVLLVANKVDHRGLEAGLHDLYGLGVGEPLPVSALHGHGSGDLLDAVIHRLEAAGAFERLPSQGSGDIPGIALIGRPNVGKSSLFNRLLGEQRTIVDERPGTTRDAVDTVVELPGGRAYRFVDTAGIRRKKAKRDVTEYFSTLRAERALERAAVALFVIDAHEPISEQEQRLARHVIDAGRGLIVVLNKWDLVDDERRGWIERERDRLLGYVAFAPLVRTSAVSGRGVDRLLPAIDRVLEQWSRRIPTAALNGWLADAVAATAPPSDDGRAVRLRYVTQVAVGPPTFRVFATGGLPPAYRRYLVRRLRERFGFEGTPLDVGVRVRPRWAERALSEAEEGRSGS